MMDAHRTPQQVQNVRSLATWVGTLFLCLHTAYVLQIGADVAYMDTLRYIGYYPDIIRSPLRVFDFWNQGGHRGLVSQLTVWANIRFFGMNILLVNVLTGFVLLLISAVVVRAWSRSLGPCGVPSPFHAAVFTLFAVFVVFGPAGFELYTLDLGFPEIARNLLYVVLIFSLLDGVGRKSAGMRWVLFSLLVLAMVFISYARVYPFGGAALLTAICVHVWRDGVRKPSSEVGFAYGGVLVGFVVFGILSKVIESSIDYAPVRPASALSVLLGTGFATSSAFVGVEAAVRQGLPAVFLCIFGLTVGFASAVMLFIYARGMKDGRPSLPIFLTLYGAMNAAAIGYARGGSDFYSYMASRYYPDLSLSLIGLAWMSSVILLDRKVQTNVRRAVAAVAALGGFFWATGYVLTTKVEVMTVPHRAIAFNEMRAITLSCAPLKEDGAIKLQANNLEIAEKARRLQMELKIGPWRTTGKNCP